MQREYYCQKCGKKMIVYNLGKSIRCYYCNAISDDDNTSADLAESSTNVEKSNDDSDLYDAEIEQIDLGDYLLDIDLNDYVFYKVADEVKKNLEKDLKAVPGIIDLLVKMIPKTEYIAKFSDEQKRQLASEGFKLMTTKNGKTMATIVEKGTNKIVSKVPIEKVDGISADITQSLNCFAMQMQMAEIAKGIENLQRTVAETLEGQENDRLATAFSCKEKMNQALSISNPELKKYALINVAHDAEDSRNLLMQSQKSNVEYIMGQPENMIGKIVSGDSSKAIQKRIKDIKRSVGAVEIMSLIEASAYQALGEAEAANKSIEYYSSYINNLYLNDKRVSTRLDMIDKDKRQIWTKELPKTYNNIISLINKKKLMISED